MKRVLLPTDFSDNAWKAMCYAAQLYHEIPCKFYILNNYSAPYDPIESGVANYFEPLEKESEAGLEKVLKQFKELDHHPSSEFVTMTNFGPIHATISHLEETEDESHIVVMGTRGASGPGELFLGTTTVGVISNVKSPVIAVPQNAILEEPKEIMLAIDQRGVDHLNEVRPLIDLAKAHHSVVSVVNIHEVEKEVVLDKNSPEEFVIDHYLEGLEHAYYSLDGEYTEDKLMDFAHGMKINLITVIHRDQGFWKNLFHSSLTKRIAYHTDIPLLVLNDH